MRNEDGVQLCDAALDAAGAVAADGRLHRERPGPGALPARVLCRSVALQAPLPEHGVQGGRCRKREIHESLAANLPTAAVQTQGTRASEKWIPSEGLVSGRGGPCAAAMARRSAGTRTKTATRAGAERAMGAGVGRGGRGRELTQEVVEGRWEEHSIGLLLPAARTC